MVGRPNILGISAFYHDSAAALLQGDEILAAAQEERFSRRKNDERFPADAIGFCLRQAGMSVGDLDAVVFYDKPIVKFTRMIESYLAVAPGGLGTFARMMPGWLSEKLDLRGTIQRELPGLRPGCEVLFTAHHEAHAASAFHPSPFRKAAILTVDGVGEWATTVIGRGDDDTIELMRELRFPHSLGLLYSAFTAYCGFRVNSGEYKLMGLAPYGEPKFAEAILRELIDLKPDGSFRLEMGCFNFLHGVTMTNERFHQLLGGPPRQPDEPITQRHCDVARSIQAVTETVMLGLARQARALTGLRQLCLAGGVALNCVANGRIQREGLFDDIWVQPAAGDAGGALGAALTAWHRHFQRRTGVNQDPRDDTRTGDRMQGALLGPAYTDAEILRMLRSRGAVYERMETDRLLEHTVGLLQSEKVVGWFQGRMEFGPRALGNRSILGDPRSLRMQSEMNLKVKYRESFRPFAPAVLRERAADYFTLEGDSPYMLLVAEVRPELRRTPPTELAGLDRLSHAHSVIPAVTHVDFSARVQTVDVATNPLFHDLLSRFAAATGCPVLVNTSFNIRGEPIVCTPDDAYRCFMTTQMDTLVIGNYVVDRLAQPGVNIQPQPVLNPD
jgi:carbamoyltransferase